MMTTKQIASNVAISAIAFMVTACGSPTVGGDEGETLAAAQPVQTADAVGTPYIAITDEDLGWRAEVPDTQTAELVVYNDFNFETSRRTQVDLSVPEATTQTAEASFCTDYTDKGNGVFEVNYDSCVLQAPLLGGELSAELSLMNQHDSVLAVVWFQDQDKPPMYKEFHFDQ